ncbi:MAG TPA: alpha/beta hydrolase [Blastocatellia bacterium]|nr:alpha/beta hydrolase [Blastocatellia bacterium]
MRNRLTVVGIVIIYSAAALASSGKSSSQQPSANHDYPPAGRLADIGGYKLHISCAGAGSPAVIFISGAGDFSFDWSLVQPAASRFSEVCSYDRAGLAWSDLGPVPRTMRQDAYELHLLLKKAGVRPPFILVGHSIGGLISRVYAARYPGEVAGMLLVDPTHEDTTLMYQGKIVRVRDGAKGRKIPSPQTMKSSSPRPPTEDDIKQQELNRRVFGPPKIEPPFDKLPAEIQRIRLWALSNPKLFAATDDYWAEELQQMHMQSSAKKFPLGNRPLIVLIPAVKEGEAPPQGVSAEEWSRINEEKRKQKLGLARLSRNSKVIIAKESGHHIQLDAPALVINAIREVVDAARKGKRLSP